MTAKKAVWTSGGGRAPYPVCTHQGCTKKVRVVIGDHDCCGHSRHDLVHEHAGEKDPRR